MQAKVSENGEVTIIHLTGQVNYESVDPFRETCRQYFQGKKVIFNLKDLSFVGSTGITTFIETIEDVVQSSPEDVKLCQVGSEFKKMIMAREINGLEIYDEQKQAEFSFSEVTEVVRPSVVDDMLVSTPEVASPVSGERPAPFFHENRPWDDVKKK